MGSLAVAQRLNCPTACGILPDQVLNPCPWHWQADSYPQCHQGSPAFFFFTNLNIYALCRASLWTQFFNSIVLKLRYRDFPGHQWLRPHTSPCASNAECAGFISGLQTKIPHAVWCGQKISKILNKIGVFLAIMLLYS